MFKSSPFTSTLLPLLTVALVAGCQADHAQPKQVLRLATTTSTRDSGLLDVLLPPFEQTHNIRVDVIAVGTGKALKLGEAGDCDLVLVHARAAEDAFMAAGHGLRRENVMYNTFEILGPPEDPAGIRGMAPATALRKIANAGLPFISRSDDSGTHKRELQLWEAVGGLTVWPNYFETGQGMGTTLTIADEMQGYVLADRGTFLNFRKKVNLQPLITGAPELKNPYGLMVINPQVHQQVKSELAGVLADYFVSPEAQALIGEYQLAGESLFYPLHSSSEK